MHKDDEETIIDNDPHLMIFQLTRSFQKGFGYFKLCTCIQERDWGNKFHNMWFLLPYKLHIKFGQDYPSCVRSWKHKKRAKTDSNSSPEWPCWLENKLIGIWYPVVKFLKHFYMYLSIAHNVTYLLTGALLLVFLFTCNDGIISHVSCYNTCMI